MNAAQAPTNKSQLKGSGNFASNAKAPLSRNEFCLDEQAVSALKNIFFFLSVIFRYPSQEIYSEIERLMNTFRDFFLEYGGAAPALPPIEDLQPEYVSLFVNNNGFVPAVPYASCYHNDGLLISNDFFRLKGIMKQSGIVLKQSIKELEDHVSVLLELCSSLLSMLIEKPSSGQCLSATISAYGEICRRYLIPMIDPFADSINSHATLNFYKINGTALKLLIHDMDALNFKLFGLLKIKE